MAQTERNGMQGSNGRGSNEIGSNADTRDDGATHLVIRADFHPRIGVRDPAPADDASFVTPIPLLFEPTPDVPQAEATTPAEVAAEREAALAEMERLRVEHRDLDDAITAIGRAVGDQLQVQRLKRRKLALRDRIRQLEDQLTPDIIA